MYLNAAVQIDAKDTSNCFLFIIIEQILEFALGLGIKISSKSTQCYKLWPPYSYVNYLKIHFRASLDQ